MTEIREVHGVTEKVELVDMGAHVAVVTKRLEPKLSPDECRYLARKLYRLARILDLRAGLREGLALARQVADERGYVIDARIDEHRTRSTDEGGVS